MVQDVDSAFFDTVLSSWGAVLNVLVSLMDERSRQGGAVLCPSSMVDCRPPVPIARLSSAQRRTHGQCHWAHTPWFNSAWGHQDSFFQGVWVLDSWACELHS